MDTAGIEFIFVPIPAKATIYPEMISEHGTTAPRTDEEHLKFYDILRKHGVNVLDLTDLFLQNRFADTGPLYHKQDTHWSGQACVLAAEAIAKSIGTPQWMAEIPKRKAKLETHSIEITGIFGRNLVIRTCKKSDYNSHLSSMVLNQLLTHSISVRRGERVLLFC